MIDERMYGLGNAPSAIRELFAYGLKRKAEIGEGKVFDYSIGNPSVPAPQKVADTIEELMKLPPVELHAYSPAAGIPAVRQTIADIETTAAFTGITLTAKITSGIFLLFVLIQTFCCTDGHVTIFQLSGDFIFLKARKIHL